MMNFIQIYDERGLFMKKIYLSYINAADIILEGVDFNFDQQYLFSLKVDRSKQVYSYILHVSKRKGIVQPEGFWGENISNVNVIMGRNGSGKTSFMQFIINNIGSGITSMNGEGVVYIVKKDETYATGKDTRLNRNLSGTFGSENYAKEELRAEIASCFLTNDLGFNNEDDNEHNKNHVAYVKSWIRIVENSPMELMSAIKDVEIISGYLKEKGNYSEIFEKKNVLGENKLTKNSIIDNVPLMEPKSINIDNKSDLIRPEEKQELKKIDNRQYKYAILQIPLENPAGYNPKNYIDLETLRKNGDEPTGNDYEIIYIESTKEKPDLEKIYERFNSGEVVPVNYYGTSVSMSDVIVTCENNSNMEVYYCDRFVFKKLDTPFLTDKIINNVKNNVDIRIEYEKLMNANITSGIADEQLERIALIDKEYKSVFNMADRCKEGNTKVDLPFPDVKEVSEEIKGYNIDRNIEESDCKKITDKERSEKIMHQRMMLGRAR